MTTSYQDRERNFCCGPPPEKSPFLPVPLEYLFPFEHPPEDKEANTKFDLKVDLTYGGSSAVPFSEDPNNSPFGFVIMVSPGAIQVTLDSRDGSHSEAIDCFDSVTEGDHTVRMLCTNPSESFNCRKIHLGHGAPGTIIQMPDSCGPGKVQRDMSDTLLWIDFSNEPEYLDRVVDEPARRKKVKRRGLNGVSGNAKPEFKAETSVNVNVNYSLTLIATIGTDKLLRCLEFTIGPNFKLMGRREGDATLGVSFEATAKLAEWDTRQTYLAENDEWVPKSDKNPKNDGTHVLKAPEFNWDFTLNVSEQTSRNLRAAGSPRLGSAVSGQPRPPCLLCGSDSGLGKREGERCSYEPIADPTCPANSSLTRRLEDLGLYDDVHGVFNIPDPELAGHLEKRKPEEKVLTWATTPGQSRSAMRPLRNMLHHGRGLNSNSECGIAIKKLNAPDTDTDQYVTEHVYEAHLLTRFTELLIDGNNGALPAGHAKASRQSPGWKGSSLFFETTFGLGGNHNKPGLALAYKVMNNRKKTQFEEGTLDSRVSASNLQNRKDPRDIFGVFSYMKDNGIVGTYLDIDIEEW
ncbi:hypothetical protein MCOR02_010315 [Pyricularia oryzae]|nr:hypothetical protein MCOR02_010315 [Pyricularia oryzae]KAI6644553.1 hypothetical protein MCOR14_001017 [Pyricularia oryzae]